MTDYNGLNGLKFLRSSTLSESLHERVENIRLDLQRAIDDVLPGQKFRVEYRDANRLDWTYKFISSLAPSIEFVTSGPNMNGLENIDPNPEFIQRIVQSVISEFNVCQHLYSGNPSIVDNLRRENISKMITVWRFEDAPEAYRQLSTSGGDEDWIAFIPEAMKDRYIPWTEEGSPFGCCGVDEFSVDGGVIRIGSHA